MFALEKSKSLEQHLLSPVEGQLILHCVHVSIYCTCKQYFSILGLRDIQIIIIAYFFNQRMMHILYSNTFRWRWSCKSSAKHNNSCNSHWVRGQWSTKLLQIVMRKRTIWVKKNSSIFRNKCSIQFTTLPKKTLILLHTASVCNSILWPINFQWNHIVVLLVWKCVFCVQINYSKHIIIKTYFQFKIFFYFTHMH